MENTSKLRNFIVALLGSVISLLGFNSCQEGEGIDDVPLMYGTPTSKFELKGKVTDQAGDPVKDALISIKQKYEGGDLNGQFLEVYSVDPTSSSDDRRVRTNSSGTYFLGSGPVSTTIRVICTPPNSSLVADSTEIKVTYVKDKNDKDRWSIGSYSGTVDFKLKKK